MKCYVVGTWTETLQDGETVRIPAIMLEYGAKLAGLGIQITDITGQAGPEIDKGHFVVTGFHKAGTHEEADIPQNIYNDLAKDPQYRVYLLDGELSKKERDELGTSPLKSHAALPAKASRKDLRDQLCQQFRNQRKGEVIHG